MLSAHPQNTDALAGVENLLPKDVETQLTKQSCGSVETKRTALKNVQNKMNVLQKFFNTNKSALKVLKNIENTSYKNATGGACATDLMHLYPLLKIYLQRVVNTKSTTSTKVACKGVCILVEAAQVKVMTAQKKTRC